MEIRGSYFLVGLFIIALTTGGILFATWILGTNQESNYNPLAIYFPGSVNGLTVGSPVKFRGVQVGTVSSISLDSKHPQYVKVMTKVDPNTPLRLDTKASLEMVGITGLAFIELKGQSDTSPPLQKQKGDNYLVIYAQESALEVFFDEFPKIIDRYNKVGNQLLELLNQQNIDSLSKTFTNMQKFSDNIVAHENNINDIILQTESSLKSFKENSNEFFNEFNYLLRVTQKTAQNVNDLTQSIKENPSQFIYQPSYDGYEVKE